MKYYRPVKLSNISQWFGENRNPVYAQLGMKGHNGIDFVVPNGTSVYWYGSGKAKYLAQGIDVLGGNYLILLTEEDGKFYSHTFFHLKEIIIKQGQEVDSGELICMSDNTGTASTGAHLHALEVKEVQIINGYWQTINKDNGYRGAIDPASKFINIFVKDYIETLQSKVGLLQKIIELLLKILKLK